MPPVADTCQVWWADPVAAGSAHLALLDDHEVWRRERLRRPADRARFVTAAALTKIVLGSQLGGPAASVRLDRTCPDCAQPHGKPRMLEPAGWEISISHAESRVAVAVTRLGPVGIDVERVDPELDITPLLDQVLSRSERAALEAGPRARRREAFFACWTRKEAVLKATGDGLRVPLTDLCVDVDQPLLRGWRGRDELPARTTVVDLCPGAGYAASLAMLGAANPTVVELNGSALLQSWAAGA